MSALRKDTEAILNICMKQGIVYRDFAFDGTERIHFTCTLYTARILYEMCESCGIELVYEERWGIPHMIKKYRNRYGIFVGIIVALAIVITARQYVWDVRISGCDTLSEEDVVTTLAEQGLYTGSRLHGLDVDAIENRVLIESDRISWIAVNLIGTVAYVEIREQLPIYESEPTAPANLVAQCDGQIETIEAYMGEVKVKIGQHVRKGDLLVSGVYDSQPWGYRYTRARGNVMARTVRTLSIEIPLVYNEKTYTGEQNTQNSIIFFSNEIKLYRNTGFLGTTYDTIYKVDKLCFPDGTKLPLTWCSTTYKNYTYEQKSRTSEEAMELAFLELDAYIDAMISEGATLLRKNIACEPGETTFVLNCTLTLVENIAETVEFEVSDEWRINEN